MAITIDMSELTRASELQIVQKIDREWAFGGSTAIPKLL